jgi:hypothetical protein
LANQRADLKRQNADRERRIAMEAREEVDRERQRAELLAAKLRKLGIGVE